MRYLPLEANRAPWSRRSRPLLAAPSQRRPGLGGPHESERRQRARSRACRVSLRDPVAATRPLRPTTGCHRPSPPARISLLLHAYSGASAPFRPESAVRPWVRQLIAGLETHHAAEGIEEIFGVRDNAVQIPVAVLLLIEVAVLVRHAERPFVWQTTKTLHRYGPVARAAERHAARFQSALLGAWGKPK